MSTRRVFRAAIVAACVLLGGCHRSEPEPQQETKKPEPKGQVVRCAVIGGMIITGLWAEVAKRFEQQTGNKVEVVVSGNKRTIAPAMEHGNADLITMHASDTIVNLVADGYAVDPQPWARNDHVIVGPTDDPAHVRGMTDAPLAMRKIIEQKAPFVQHRGNGANEVLRAVLDEGKLALDDKLVFRLADDENQESVLEFASQKHAYSLVGFIPFKMGKMQGAGVEVMVEGDPHLRRPYLVAVANPKRWPEAHHEVARALAAFLRSPETQAFLAAYGREKFGGHAPFSPVSVP